MKDELTTKMHSEFSLNLETETKHTVWVIIQQSANREDIERLLTAYGISKDDFNKHKNSYPDKFPIPEDDLKF